MNRRRSNILVFVVFLVLSLGVSELVLKLYFPLYLIGDQDSYQYDEVLGVRLKENLRSHITTDYQQETVTNSYGSVNWQDSFADYEFLVFAIGDSYTQGTGLPFDASYPFQLSQMLNLTEQGYVPRYAVINLGIAAFGTLQAIETIRIYQEIYGKPDFILYLGSGNDHSDDQLYRSGYRHRHTVDGNPRNHGYLAPAQWLANNTEMGKRLKLAVGTWKKDSIVAESAESDLTRPPTTSVAQLQESALEELLRVAKGLDAELIVSWSDMPPATPGNSYQWLERWAEQEGVKFADWHPQLESVLAAVPELPLTNPHSGGHYRSWVNEIIAECFATEINPGSTEAFTSRD